MQKLTTENVDAVFFDCLFKEGEDTSKAVIADGLQLKVGFHPERLAANRATISELLAQLPDELKESKGGGWSFLNACQTKDGDQWGEHRNIEQLLLLGIATEQAKLMFTRDFWKGLPGGMPYFKVCGDADKLPTE